MMPPALRVTSSQVIKAASQPDLVTIPNVPIVSTGTYELASPGTHTFTPEDLADAVRATEDPACHAPRLKIGHSSQFGDGEPAFGKVINMRLSANGQEIIGDYVGVPRWLAELMPTAYPSRSIEGPIEATTATGNTYGLIIEAVSLLGVVAPGVSTLADLPDLYGSDQPSGVEIKAGNRVQAKEVGGLMKDGYITASVQIEDVRREYYDSLDANQMWWWIRTIRVEPYELIVDDDEGNLFRVPFDPTGDEITFSDPVEVEIVYVDKAKAATASKADGAVSGQEVAGYTSREESRPEVKASKEQEDQVKLSADQLKALGLPEGATQEEVDAKIADITPDAPPEPSAETETPEAPEKPESPEAEVETPEPAPAAAASGTRTIDAEKLAELERNAAAGAKAHAKQEKDHRERILNAAVKAGKIPPARKEHYAKMFEADPEGTETLLTASEDKGGLAASAVPTIEAGGGGGELEDQEGEAYPASWLPEVAARKAAVGGDQRVIQTDPKKGAAV